MTKPASPVPPRSASREPRTPPTRRESSTPSNASTEGGARDREGGENSEPAGAETGAGATFSGSRVLREGSDVAHRGTRRPPSASAEPSGAEEPENLEAAPEGSAGQTAESEVTPADPRRRITRAGWRAVAPDEGDLGSGFYRFRAKDIPGLPERSRMATVLECFGTDLANARVHMRIVIAQARRVAVDSVDVSALYPFEFRPTRLCKRARKARGEA